MIPDAFRRLALIAACTAYVVALAVVWEVLGPGFALIAAFLGPIIAVGVTLDLTPTPKEPEPKVVEQTLARADVNLLDAELKRRERHGEVPVATRKGRPLASVEGSIKVEKT